MPVRVKSLIFSKVQFSFLQSLVLELKSVIFSMDSGKAEREVHKLPVGRNQFNV